MTQQIGAILLCVSLAACWTADRQGPQENVSAPGAQHTESQFDNLLIKVPGSAPEQAKVYLVQHGVKHWVIDSSWLASRGYRIPEDVREVTVAEFGRLPTGTPIR